MILQDDIQNNKLQLLGKLAASLAHEIRNPLSAIKLNLEFIKMMEVNDEIKESIYNSIEAARRIQSLIENTLDFSRSSQDSITSQQLNDSVELAIDIMQSKSRVLNIKFEKNLTPNLPLVCFNKNKFLQVLLNLISNAFEAIEQNGIVRINTYKETVQNKEFVVFEIEDNGIGINEEEKEKIFNDFYTNKIQGTGLGLSVCKMILDEYNADISFESIVGKGTKFFVKFSPVEK